MPRAMCAVCLRPEKTCICYLFVDINNSVDVIVLQHPSEVKQTKGTVTLLSHSLKHCHVVVGENFNQHDELTHLLKPYKNNVYLLYPSENAAVLEAPIHNEPSTMPLIDFSSSHAEKHCIILIDGTWKKSYKMYMLNTFLHHLPHFTLPESIAGDYAIRKTQKANALSSLEACTYALMVMELDNEKYQPLLTSFRTFNHVQLSLRELSE